MLKYVKEVVKRTEVFDFVLEQESLMYFLYWLVSLDVYVYHDLINGFKPQLFFKLFWISFYFVNFV